MLKWNAKTGAVSHVNRCRINALILTTVKINGWKGGPLCWKWDYADKTASEAQRWAEWKHWTHHTRSHTLSHTQKHTQPLFMCLRTTWRGLKFRRSKEIKQESVSMAISSVIFLGLIVPRSQTHSIKINYTRLHIKLN